MEIQNLDYNTSTPCSTLYVHNLNEKIQLYTLKKMLYMLFKQFGNVVEIRASKGNKKRGQAWISFDNIDNAMRALKKRQNFNFFDKPLQIEFARVKSDILSKVDGTYVPRDRKERYTMKSRNKRKLHDNQNDDNASKKSTKGEDISTNNIPHNIIFAQKLPTDCTPFMIDSVFQNCTGFQGVRIVPGNRGMAFIDFSNEFYAGEAINNLNNTKIGDSQCWLTFAKK